MSRIGIDLGGTKIEGVVLAHDGRVEQRERLPTPAGDYQATLSAVVHLVGRLEQRCGRRCSIGIGTPGALSPATGRLRNANSTCLNNQAVDQDLSIQLDRPVRVANDADCFALSEAKDGAARGAHSAVGVILGTGTGSGIVIDGQLLQGPTAIAGEWGHNPLPWPSQDEHPGPQCYCGKRGCIETFLSGPGMALDYATHTSRSCTARDIVERAGKGEIDAMACLTRYADRLARSLASVVNILDPEVIVLGGGLSRVQELYTTVPQLWSSYIFSDVVRTRLLPPVHGDSSGVLGAARLWPAHQSLS